MQPVEAVKDDLPDRFGAMLVKELRQNMRRGSFIYPFLAIQLFAVMALLYELRTEAAYSSAKYAGMLNLGLLFQAGPFWVMVATICAFIMPLGGLVLMGQELEDAAD